MKLPTRNFAATLLLLSSLHLIGQVDSTYNWFHQMYEEGITYSEIESKTDSLFQDTSTHHGRFGYKDYFRWSNFWNSRVSVTEQEIENEEGYPSFNNLRGIGMSMLNNSFCSDTTSNWIFLGPKSLPNEPQGKRSPNGLGFINAVEFDYSDTTGNTYYAGSPTGGLWKTTNGGQSWTCLTDNTSIPALGISDIAIDPNNSQVIYIATETRRFVNRSYGVGILKSNDGGQSWTTTGLSYTLGMSKFAQAIKTHPTNSNKLIALVGNEIQKSNDAGLNWSVVATIPVTNLPNNKTRKRYLRDIKYHPTDTNILYATSDDFSKNDGGALLYKSTDGGQNWSDITTNLNLSYTSDRIDISVSPNTPDNLYLAISRGGSTDIFKSNDKGVNWGVLSSSPIGTHRGGYYKNEFEISPTDSTVMYLGGILMTKSVNEGSSFYKITERISGHSRFMHDDVRDIQVVFGSTAGTNGINDILLVGNDGGISRTVDGGANWELINNNLSVVEFWSFDIAKDRSYMVGGMQDQGFLRYDFNTKQWYNPQVYADGGATIISNKNLNEVFGLTFPGRGMMKSSNEMVNYFGFPISNIGFYHENVFSFNQNESGELFASAINLYKLNTTTSTWEKTSTLQKEIRATAISKSDQDRIYVGVRDPLWDTCSTPSCMTGKLYRSDDEGLTWTDITYGLNAIQWVGISDIVVNPKDPDELWVSFEHFWANHRVFHSTDAGNTWTNYSNGLPNFPINTMTFQEEAHNRVFAGTDVGVYYRDTTMSSWECFSNNLPTTIVAQLRIDNSCQGTLIAGTFGRGFWETDLPKTVISSSLTWDTKKSIGSDLIIEGTLTIKDTLEMAKNTKIIVKPSGALVVDGGLITSSTCNDGFWQGIELEGDDTEAQSASTQPIFNIKNGGEISNAKVAVRTGKTDSNGNFVSGTAGGIIFGYDATFKNNETDIIMHPYQGFVSGTNPPVLIRDLSELYRCDFISDEDLPNNLVTSEHIFVEGIDGLDIEGCTFKNDLAQTNLSDRGTAIKAYNSSISVKETGSSTPLFENFYLAIDSYTSNPIYTPTIRKADFINNVKGVLISGNDYATLTENNFEIMDAGSSHEPYGLYLNWSSGYEIEENDFTYTGGGTASNAVGLVVVNSNDNANEIYRNNFDHLQAATLVHGDNKKDGTNEGLVIKCNDYDEDAFHIALEDLPQGMFGTLYPEIAFNQGGNASQTDPAGNTFNDLCNSGGVTDIIVSSNGSAFNYFHHSDAITTPLCRTTTKVTNVDALMFFTSQDESCPSNLSGDGGGGGPGPGPGLILHSDNSFEEQLSEQLSNKNNAIEELQLNDYIRLKLNKDTIEMDSVILALAASGTANNQMRMIAAMARKGDTTFNDKSMQNLLSGKALTYLNFTQDMQFGGKYYEEATRSNKNPYFMWARAYERNKNNEDIPSNYQLPQNRIRILDEGNGESSITVYPNPTDEQMTIHMEGFDEKDRIHIDILDIKGSLLKSLPLKSINQKQNVSVAELKNGMYLLNIHKNGKLIATERFGIQH